METPSQASTSLKSSAEPTKLRLDAIDFVRGIVMVIMALDHTRDYLGTGAGLPRDVHEPALFLTRWITNFCAPTFVFLAGISAFLYGQRVSNKAKLSKFLLTRGLWLVLCEVTLVHFGLSFSFWPDFVLLQVIWAIGWSMVILAGAVFLPGPVLLATGLLIVLGHNLTDGVKAESWGPFKVLWQLLHQPGLFPLDSQVKVLAMYPLLPWAGTMLLGYGLGPLFLLPPHPRRKALLRWGLAAILFFTVVRATNVYGDPAPWTKQKELWASVLSFVNCEKYPPSLLFLALTLGPALLALAVLDQVKGPWARFFITFGRVPFFYYLLHLYLIHLVTVMVVLVQTGQAGWLVGGLPPMVKPPTWGFSLPAVYAWWAMIVLTLYPLCRWFSRVKQTRKEWWLSYL